MGGGWFVVNARDAAWAVGDPFGAQCAFEGAWRDADAPLTSRDL